MSRCRTNPRLSAQRRCYNILAVLFIVVYGDLQVLLCPACGGVFGLELLEGLAGTWRNGTLSPSVPSASTGSIMY
jgi:hypothetical protein